MATTGGSISFSSFPSFSRRAKPNSTLVHADSLELRHIKMCKCSNVLPSMEYPQVVCRLVPSPRNIACFAAQESSSLTGNFLSYSSFIFSNWSFPWYCYIHLIIANTTSCCWNEGEERVRDCWRNSSSKTKAKACSKSSSQVSTSDDGGGCYPVPEINSWSTRRYLWARVIV